MPFHDGTSTPNNWPSSLYTPAPGLRIRTALGVYRANGWTNALRSALSSDRKCRDTGGRTGWTVAETTFPLCPHIHPSNPPKDRFAGRYKFAYTCVYARVGCIQSVTISQFPRGKSKKKHAHTVFAASRTFRSKIVARYLYIYTVRSLKL